MAKLPGLLLATAALLALAACNKGSAATPAAAATAQASPAVQPAAAAEQPAASLAAKPQTSGTLKLASGEEAPMVRIPQLTADPQAHAGLIALEGRVILSDQASSRFVLVDCDKKPGCMIGCWPEGTLPVKVAMENYQGNLPASNAKIVVIGELLIDGQKFRLDVREVREGDKVILKKLAQAH